MLRLFRSLAAGLLLAFLPALGLPARSQDLPEGKVLWDSGFRPSLHGFGFENYGNDSVRNNLTIEEMKKLFGDVVCANSRAENCILTPPAAHWMKEVNKAMNAGHCDGMATLAPLFQVKHRDPAGFGSSVIPQIALAENDAIAREIAFWYATQATSPTFDQEIADKTPKEIVDILVQTEKSKGTVESLYVIGIYLRDGMGGHSVTPYAVVDRGNGINWIMIYDNNHPGRACHIEVDRQKNTWSYSASTRPGEKEHLYEGDDSTFNLTLTPTSARVVRQEASFDQLDDARGIRGAAKVRYNEVFLDGWGDLLLTDSTGRRLGWIEEENAEGEDVEKFVREIPGARVVFLRGVDYTDLDVEPLYRVPTNMGFTVTLDGESLTSTEPSDIVMIGPGYNLAVEDIVLAAHQRDQITFSPDGRRITYAPGGDVSPWLVIGRVGEEADYRFEIRGAKLQRGAQIDVQLEFEKQRLRIEILGTTKRSTLVLEALRIDDDDEEGTLFENDSIVLAPREVGWLEYENWDDEEGSMVFSIDSNGDGIPDREVILWDESE